MFYSFPYQWNSLQERILNLVKHLRRNVLRKYLTAFRCELFRNILDFIKVLKTPLSYEIYTGKT